MNNSLIADQKIKLLIVIHAITRTHGDSFICLEFFRMVNVQFGHLFSYRCFDMIFFIELINYGANKNKQLQNDDRCGD